MSIAQKVTELREKLGWNQAKLAKIAGVTQATLSRIEAGKITHPSIEQLQKLSEALGVSIDYLWGENKQLSFDDLKKDKDALTVFRGWGNLSPSQKKQLAKLVQFFEQEEDDEDNS